MKEIKMIELIEAIEELKIFLTDKLNEHIELQVEKNMI
jgi:hypothetical protein